MGLGTDLGFNATWKFGLDHPAHHAPAHSPPPGTARREQDQTNGLRLPAVPGIAPTPSARPRRMSAPCAQARAEHVRPPCTCGVGPGNRVFCIWQLWCFVFVVTESSTGPIKLFKEMNVAHVGCHCSGVPGSLLSGTLSSYGASTIARTSDRGHVVEA